jgi:hypothetical protein
VSSCLRQGLFHRVPYTPEFPAKWIISYMRPTKASSKILCSITLKCWHSASVSLLYTSIECSNHFVLPNINKNKLRGP